MVDVNVVCAIFVIVLFVAFNKPVEILVVANIDGVVNDVVINAFVAVKVVAAKLLIVPFKPNKDAELILVVARIVPAVTLRIDN